MHVAPADAQRRRCAALLVLLLLAPAAAQVGSTVTPATVRDAAAAGAAWHDLPPFAGAEAVLGRNGTGADTQIALGSDDGTNWTVLSTGRALSGATARAPGGPGTDHGIQAHGVHDPATVAWDLRVPAPHDCLFIHFRFLTDQWPPAAHEAADGMLLSWGTDGWSAGGSGFATADGRRISSGSAQVDAAGGAGTGFVAGTPPIVARAPVAAGEGRLFGSVYDGGHGAVDSALHVDGIETFFTGGREATTADLDACAAGPVTLEEGPALSWTPERPQACAEVLFTASGKPKHAVEAWDFRDGNGSLAEAPVHRYGKPGTYNVTRVVSGPESQVQVRRAQLHVEGACPIEARPGGPWHARIGGILHVAGEGAGGIAPYTCAWSGNERLRVQSQGPCKALLEPHAAGTFTLRLEVTDAAGNKAENTTTVHVARVAESRPRRADPPPDAEGPSPGPGPAPVPAGQADGDPPETGTEADAGPGPMEPAAEPSHEATAPRVERHAASVTPPRPAHSGGVPWLAVLLMTVATAGTGAIVIAAARRGSGP